MPRRQPMRVIFLHIKFSHAAFLNSLKNDQIRRSLNNEKRGKRILNQLVRLDNNKWV